MDVRSGRAKWGKKRLVSHGEVCAVLWVFCGSPPRLPVMLCRCAQRFDIRAIVPRFARESRDAFEGKPRLRVRSENRGVTKQATEVYGASVPFRSHVGVPNLYVPIWWLALFNLCSELVAQSFHYQYFHVVAYGVAYGGQQRRASELTIPILSGSSDSFIGVRCCISDSPPRPPPRPHGPRLCSAHFGPAMVQP